MNLQPATRRIIVLLLFAAALAALPGAAQDQHAAGSGQGPYISAQGLVFPLQNPPTAINSASVTNTGSQGLRKFWYWIVTNAEYGQSVPAGPFLLPNAANSYGAGNGAQITWQGVGGALSYDVLRTPAGVKPSGACGCAVLGATGLSVPYATDSSNSLGAYTVAPDTGNQAVIRMQNQVTGFEANCLALVNVDEVATCITGGGGGGPTIQTNGTDNTSQTVLNFVNTASVTWSNPSGGVEEATAIAGGTPGNPPQSVQYNCAGAFCGNAGLLYNPAPGAERTDLELTTEDPSGQDNPLSITSSGQAVNIMSIDTNGLNGMVSGNLGLSVDTEENDDIGTASIVNGIEVLAILSGASVEDDALYGQAITIDNVSTGSVASTMIGQSLTVDDASTGRLSGPIIGSLVTLEGDQSGAGNAFGQEVIFGLGGVAGGINAALYVPDPTVAGDTAAYAAYLAGGKFLFSSDTGGISPDPCPSCFIANAIDEVQAGGKIDLEAYGTTGGSTGGGAILLQAASPDESTEVESGGSGTITIESLSDIGTDGASQASMLIATGAYDDLQEFGGATANILEGACIAGAAANYSSDSCDLTMISNGGGQQEGSHAGNTLIEAESNGFSNSGQITLQTTGNGLTSPVDATEDAINLCAGGYCGAPGMSPINLWSSAAYVNGNPIAASVFTGVIDLTTATVSSYTCNTVTLAAAGVLTSDHLAPSSVGSLKAISGYAPNALGSLDVNVYVDGGGGQLDADVCNRTAADITPADAQISVGVYRP